MILLIFTITFLYLLLIGSFIYGFDKVEEFKYIETPTKTTFSIIIPFRNEAENLPELLQSILKLEYPVSDFEIIFVNDDSSDASIEIIKTSFDKTKIDFKIIQNPKTSKSPKKEAITTAIKLTKNDWIITTDADCVLPKHWLESFNSFIYKRQVNMIVGPVSYSNAYTFLDSFQTLDFLSLIGATIGGFGLKTPFLCNGANLAYKKDFFNTLNGFEGNEEIASGDDIFLLEKAIEKYRNTVLFLKAKEAIVFTKTQPDFKSLKSQRIRWASKTTHYKNTFGKLTGLLVLLMNASIICLFLLTIFDAVNGLLLLIVFLIKMGIDFMLLFKTATFFNQATLLSRYPISAMLYPFFSTYIAVLSLFINYKWKDRAYRK